MTVKDLLSALEQCNPDAEICIEANMDHSAHIVKQYDVDDNVTQVYIADDLTYVDDYMAGCFEQCSTKLKEEW